MGDPKIEIDRAQYAVIAVFKARIDSWFLKKQQKEKKKSLDFQQPFIERGGATCPPFFLFND